MAANYKLTYFDFSGLGEPIRLLLHYGGIDFIDNRISQEDWPAIKDTTPLGQMPVLEFEGRKMIQSTAIARFLAKQVGLAGDNDFEAYEIDAAVETCNDLRAAIAQYGSEKDPERKKELKKILDATKLEVILPKLDSWASSSGYLANGKLSWADLYFFAITTYLPRYYDGDFLKNYPNLLAVNRNVLSIPAIKAWVDKRPPENFSF